MTSPDPCKACGKPVRTIGTNREASLDNPTKESERRVCTNPQCDSNTGQGSLSTVV
jgi:hypothetical protein